MTSICEKITGNTIPIGKIQETRPADLRAYITDNSKIKNEIGWEPQKSVEDIFNDIFNWINQNEKQLEGILK